MFYYMTIFLVCYGFFFIDCLFLTTPTTTQYDLTVYLFCRLEDL